MPSNNCSALGIHQYHPIAIGPKVDVPIVVLHTSTIQILVGGVRGLPFPWGREHGVGLTGRMVGEGVFGGGEEVDRSGFASRWPEMGDRRQLGQGRRREGGSAIRRYGFFENHQFMHVRSD